MAVVNRTKALDSLLNKWELLYPQHFSRTGLSANKISLELNLVCFLSSRSLTATMRIFEPMQGTYRGRMLLGETWHIGVEES